MTKALRVSFLFLAVSALAFLVAARLPYRTGELVYVDAPSTTPEADGSFSVGDLRWDTPYFAREPKLEPLRSFFHARCDGKVGAAAAACVSDAFALAFPRGEPAHELFDPTYDPAADLAVHMAGEAGHCVTRSGLMSAVLLSAGIPAKVVQFLGASGSGHTVMAVWEAGRGWLVYDPSFGAFITNDGRPTSVSRLVAMPNELTPVRGGVAPAPQNVGDVEFYDTLEGPGLTVMVPEPWLYMRVGEHRAHAPFRGRFAVLGPGKWTMGPAQTTARGVFVGGLLLAFASASAGFLRRRRAAAALEPSGASVDAAE